jgi:hypothetical protein
MDCNKNLVSALNNEFTDEAKTGNCISFGYLS